jgi:hypothetical protein
MSRRNLYNQVLKFFTFCAPVGFRHEDQPVDIVDIYHKYDNPEKKYIFTLRDNNEDYTSTSYNNPLGKGDRRLLIDYSQNGSIFSDYNPIDSLKVPLLDGYYSIPLLGSPGYGYLLGAVAGCYMQFDFKKNKLIQEAKLYQDLLSTHGIWRWQGSTDGSTFINIGNTFTFGTDTVEGIHQVGYMTELNSNTTPYRYYRLLGISGNASYQPYLLELEFKINGQSGPDKFALTQGTNAVHGYELSGVSHQDSYDVFETTIVGVLPAGNYTEIPVLSTSGAKDSGVIRIRDTALYVTERFRYFVYTSKTSTSFIGESQAIVESSGLVHQVVETKGTNNYIIVNGNIYGIQSRTWNAAVVIDDVAGIDAQVGVTAGAAYEWLYCGKDVQELDVGSYGLGFGSVKYIHLENETQLTHINYCDFYGVPLIGELNIPKSITEIGYVSTEPYNYWVGFRAGYLTKVTISENVVLIVDSFNYFNTIQRFDCYPLIAPTIITDGNSFMNGHPVQLHIRPEAIGYDIAPWTDTNIFTSIIRDL